MQSIIFKFSSILLFFLSLTTYAADNAKIFTSNGVIYSYAVQTKTLQPAKLIYSTRYYTTVSVREITLAGNAVSTTTEKLLEESIFQTSVPVSVTSAKSLPSVEKTVAPKITSSVASRVTKTLSPNTSKSTMSTLSLLQDPVKQMTSTASSSKLITTTSKVSESAITSYAITSSVLTTTSNTEITHVEEQQASVTPTSTIVTTTTTNPTSLITSAPMIRSTTTLMPKNDPTIQTPTAIDGTCYVYEDDLNDEYYSTAYISGTQTVDAATTITSYRTVYKTMTVN